MCVYFFRQAVPDSHYQYGKGQWHECVLAPYMQISSGTCASRGYSSVVGIDRCVAAATVVARLPNVKDVSKNIGGIYGGPGCDIGVDDKNDYGQC